MVEVIHLCIIISNTHENRELNLPIGGAGNQLLELIPFYEKNKNIRISLITKYSECNPIHKKLKIIKIHRFRNRQLDTLYFEIKSFFTIIKLNKNDPIDIINVNSYYFKLLIPLIIRFIFKKPLFIKTPGDFQTHYFEAIKSGPKSLSIKFFYYGWMNFFKNYILKKKKIFIQAINRKIYDDLIQLGFNQANLLFLPNGISIQKYIGLKKKTHDNIINFGYAGRLVENKNIRFMFNVFLKYLKLYPEDKLLIYGKGDEAKYIKDFIARNNVSKNILYYGFEKDKLKIYSNIDVLIHPSLGEGVSNSILEGILARTFIIASNVSGNRDIIENEVTGLIFNPFVEQELLDQLIKYKRGNCNVSQILNNAMDLVRKNYDIERVVERIIAFLRERIKI